MKTGLSSLISLLLVIVLTGCSPEYYQSNEKIIEFHLQHGDTGFSQKIVFSQDGALLSAADELNIASFLKERFIVEDLVAVQEIEGLLYVDDNKRGKFPIVTLVGIGINKEGNNVPVAAEFLMPPLNSENETPGSKNSTGNLSTTHSCTGAPCACCEFRREFYERGLFWDNTKYVRIVGCSCLADPSNEACPEPSGSCNHTVTDSGG